MNRFFVAPTQVNSYTNEIIIIGEDVKHISKVLRLSRGDSIEICDGEAFEYIGEITSIDSKEVVATIVDKYPIHTEAPIEVCLYQGVPKGAKMELIIQKTTEMGIREIIPVLTERTIVQFKDKKDQEKKIDRWQKIAHEAGKQSKRGIIPTINMPLTLKEAISHSKNQELSIIAYEKETEQGLKGLLKSYEGKGIRRIGIWVGPEGGFSQDEINLAIESGINSVTLGPRILRTETAGFGLLSILMYELGDLGGS